MFPTADQIAKAIVEACRLTGDKPVATCMRQTSRARHVAFAALIEIFPEARRESLARLVGYPTPRAGTAALGMARKTGWWNDDLVDEVVGSLVGDQYGEQAA